MIVRDATTFPQAEVVVAAAIKALLPHVYVSNATPETMDGPVVTIGVAGGGRRAWANATVNIGVNVYDTTDTRCRALVNDVQDALAATSNDFIESVSVPAGGATSVPRQTPPFQRYFAATVYLRAQDVIDDERFDAS